MGSDIVLLSTFTFDNTCYRERGPSEHVMRSSGETFIYKQRDLLIMELCVESMIYVVIQECHVKSNLEENYVWY
jgi:hypothetical protein